MGIHWNQQHILISSQNNWNINEGFSLRTPHPSTAHHYLTVAAMFLFITVNWGTPAPHAIQTHLLKKTEQTLRNGNEYSHSGNQKRSSKLEYINWLINWRHVLALCRKNSSGYLMMIIITRTLCPHPLSEPTFTVKENLPFCFQKIYTN